MKNTGLAIVLAAGVSIPTVAVAQPTMLAPGVYTTPEISARCQEYAARRVGNSSAGDRERTTVFIACVRKLYGNRGAPPAGSASLPAEPTAPLVTAPVSLGGRYYGGGEVWHGSFCATDEGYGRLGNCSSG